MSCLDESHEISALPAEETEHLISVLRQLASLVRQHGVPEEAVLDSLAISADTHFAIPNSARNKEISQDRARLKQWAIVLMSARTDRSPASRARACASLIDLGAPETPASFAVDEAIMDERTLIGHIRATTDDCERIVMKSQTMPGAPIPIAAHPLNLGFGMLAPDTQGQVSIEVSGGPGRVVTLSDMLTVSPSTFGPHTTQLSVSVRAGTAGQILHTSIALVSGVEKLEISVTAAWGHRGALRPPLLGIATASIRPGVVQSARVAITTVIPRVAGRITSTVRARAALRSASKLFQGFSSFTPQRLTSCLGIALPWLRSRRLMLAGMAIAIVALKLIVPLTANLRTIRSEAPARHLEGHTMDTPRTAMRRGILSVRQSKVRTDASPDRIAVDEAAKNARSAQDTINQMVAQLIAIQGRARKGRISPAEAARKYALWRPKCSEALILSERAVQLDPGNIEGWRQRVRASYYLAHYAEADTFVTEALRRFPNDSDLKTLRVRIRTMRDQPQLSGRTPDL